ncbi:hypothetical protein BS50DRAFT_571803 [Corynespora cassiicola Philippines]|uniref:Pentatricopeptide repeat protein-like protein n=1 Tax=Corynespora cassiicola Philippines TaxID=1448308 RepID=A0A2T2NSX4_CORCC|nr:hypothetical protein BS50DRAFT_571803 [Corynespora cassiicola Philippines]
MSLFRSLDRTTCTAAVSSSAATTTPSSHILAFLCPAFTTFTPHAPRRSFSRRPVTRPVTRLPRAPGTPDPTPMDSFFISALARAASCPEHARQISSLSAHHHRPRRKSTCLVPGLGDRREFRTKTERRGPFKRLKQFAQDELKALVDYYGIESGEREDEELPDDAPLIWNVGDDHEPWPLRDPQHHLVIHEMEKLLKDKESPHEDIFELYKMLPSPGVVYLRIQTIRALLHHLSVVERPTRAAMQRFFYIMDHMQTAHIHLNRSEWTSAIYFAGRFTGNASPEDLQSALHIWHDMERRAAIQGSIVTLNVLFDIAVRAGKYTLAETFIREIEVRKLKPHRHFRVSLMYYYGVCQDGNKVRRVYQEMVQAGDVIDTVVMNAVIASLIRAGEPGAAEHVFERMKRLDAVRNAPHMGARTPFSQPDWRSRRVLGLRLTNKAPHLADESARKSLQDLAPLGPNARSYGLLLRHHASTAGNVDRVYELLNEMRLNGIPYDGTVFIVVFRGFARFGGVRYSFWTADKLERLWKDFLQAASEHRERTWLSSLAVNAALTAFAKCANGERTMRAWEEVRALWEPEHEELEQTLKLLRNLVPQGGFFDEYRGD